ncbi:MAG: RNA polymerase subunit sigma-70 [Sphingomonas sp. 28-62-20]|nr:MAG: RNA polymerase subunit sigma-70 [Sphingomonas sp. 28-62-20]
MLLRLFTARLGSRDEAEDLLQEMWLKIDGLSDYPVAEPAAFLFRVAANLATDRRIASSKRAARDTAWIEHRPAADDVPDAERVLIAKDEWRIVEAALNDMPERMATALRLSRIEGKPQRAIAEALGISVSGVEKLLQRGYRKIYDQFGQSDADMGGRHRLDQEGSPDRAR